MTSIKGRYFRRIMDERGGLYFYYKDRYLLLIHKYYCKCVFLHTYLSHYILSVLVGSLLLAIVHLLPQINVRKDMPTALFCVVYALPVFIISAIVQYQSKILHSSHVWIVEVVVLMLADTQTLTFLCTEVIL